MDYITVLYCTGIMMASAFQWVLNCTYWPRIDWDMSKNVKTHFFQITPISSGKKLPLHFYSYLSQLLVDRCGSIHIGKLKPSRFQYNTVQWSSPNGLKGTSILNIHSYTKKQMWWHIGGGTFSKLCIFSNIIWAPEGLKKPYYIFVCKFQFEWSTLVCTQ